MLIMSYVHSVCRHVQHHFYGLSLALQALTWGAEQGVVYNRKGAWQLKG